jgi:hypothetical protein
MRLPRAMPKPKMSLRLIPEPDPETRVIFQHNGPGTIALSGTDRSAPDLCCGSCEAPLVRGIAQASAVSIIFRCNGCGAFNELVKED